MNEEDVREALLTWVSGHTCYGSKAAQDMHIKKIEATMALHVSLIDYYCTKRISKIVLNICVGTVKNSI